MQLPPFYEFFFEYARGTSKEDYGHHPRSFSTSKGHKQHTSKPGQWQQGNLVPDKYKPEMDVTRQAVSAARKGISSRIITKQEIAKLGLNPPTRVGLEYAVHVGRSGNNTSQATIILNANGTYTLTGI